MVRSSGSINVLTFISRSLVDFLTSVPYIRPTYSSISSVVWMYLSVWFGSKSYINPDRPVHFPVNLGIIDLMGSSLLVFYFRFANFHPSEFKEFLGGFAVPAVAAVSMEPVGFSMIFLALVYGPIS